MPPHAARTVFAANISYDVSEEQLAGVFSEVGPVSNVEIKFDPQTGRSKGYAFVQFYDEATAQSAVRNLQEVLVNGRNLRVESSTDEPGPRRRGGGGDGGGGPAGGVRGGGAGGGGGGGGGARAFSGRDETPPRLGGAPYTRRDDEPMSMTPMAPSDGARIDINLLPMGQDVPPGQKATDIISKTLAAISPGQMQDVMSGMKTLVSTQPDQARQLLQSKPQLAYALFQAMLLMNIIDPSVLQRIQPMPPASTPQSYPPPPATNPPYPPYPPSAPQQPPAGGYPPYPPQGVNAYRPPPDPRQGYNAPPPPQNYGGAPPAPAPAPGPAPGYGAPLQSAPIPPHAQAALATLPEEQRAMLMQVLSMTPEQIQAADPSQRASIMQLRQQFLGSV